MSDQQSKLSQKEQKEGQKEEEQMINTLNYWFNSALSVRIDGHEQSIIHKFRTITSCILKHDGFHDYCHLVGDDAVKQHDDFQALYTAQSNRNLKHRIRVFKRQYNEYIASMKE